MYPNKTLCPKNIPFKSNVLVFKIEQLAGIGKNIFARRFLRSNFQGKQRLNKWQKLFLSFV